MPRAWAEYIPPGPRAGTARAMLAIVLLAAQAASPTWAPMVKIGPNPTAAAGRVVTLSGDGKTMAVGDPSINANAGRVRVYTRAGTTWEEKWTQFGADITGTAGLQIGGALTLSNDGNTLAIGGTNAGNAEAGGVVRVYERNTGGYAKIGDLSTGQTDSFGFSVTLSGDGNTLAVGDPTRANSDGNVNAGSVRVYKRGNNDWDRIAELSGTAVGESVGSSISLNDDGTTLAVGAPYTFNPTVNAGLVRVYTRAGDAWTKSGDDINGDAAEAQFGYSVSLSGDGQTLAVGGQYNSAGGVGAGHARVYARDGDTWNTINTIIGPAGSNFGFSISLSKDSQTLAVGGRQAAVDAKANAGFVVVHKLNGNEWAQSGRFYGAHAGEQVGYSVSLSANGATVAIGTGTTTAQVHEYWVPVPYVPPKRAAGCSDQCVGGYASTPVDLAGVNDFAAQFATLFQRIKHVSQFHCTAPGLSQITTVAECTAAAQLVGQSKSDAVSSELSFCASGPLGNAANDGDYAFVRSWLPEGLEDTTVLCHCRPCDDPSTSLQSPWWTALGITAGATGALVPIGIAGWRDA